MNNNAFRRTLISLSHPLSIAAIIVVLLNDHWWQRVAPSWLTGKIGDFAWLIFAPFLLAVILAWLFPRHEKFVGQVSIVGVGLIFGLAKTVPVFHTLTINVLEFLTSWPNILRLDPTDLIALPALLIAWWIWEWSAVRSSRLADRGWVLLPLAVLATMADSPAPNYGIACLEQEGGQIYTADAFASYTSLDGGLTWQASKVQLQTRICDGRMTEVISPNDSGLRFRYGATGLIERSNDRGQTWQREYAVMSLSQAQSAYAKQGSSTAVLETGPLSALIDARTGNAIFALGHQGVLVRTPAGEWRAVEVGPYHAIDLRQPEKVVSVLSGEILLAAALIALVSATITPSAYPVHFRQVATLFTILIGFTAVTLFVGAQTHYPEIASLVLLGLPLILFIYRKRNGRGATLVNTVLTLGWVAWLATLFITPPALITSYERSIPILGTVAVTIFGVPVAIQVLISTFSLNPKTAWLAIGLGVLTALLFLVPFIIWTQNGIPYYYTAAVYAVILVAVMCLAGYRYLRRDALTSTSVKTA